MSRSTCLSGELDALFDHVQQISQIFVCGGQPLDVILHPDDQDGAASLILTAEAILA